MNEDPTSFRWPVCHCGRGQGKPHNRDGDCPAGKADPMKPGRLRELGRINGRPSAYERATKFRKDSTHG